MLSMQTLLRLGGLRPKKQLGQNFLQDLPSTEMIVQKAGVAADDTVLEIGPGLGTFTVALAQVAKHVIAVEKDEDLIPLLAMQLVDCKLANKVTTLKGDILHFNMAEHLAALPKKAIVCGNLPYNISSQVLVRLIEARPYIAKAILMFQKELADRLMAAPGGKDYGRISAMLQYCAEIKPLAVLKPKSFLPPPQVDSTVVEISFRETLPYPPHSEQMLFRVIKGSFGNRRKTIKNSLAASGLGLTAAEAGKVLEQSNINPERRAETLDPAEFVTLALSVEAFKKPRPCDSLDRLKRLDGQ